MKKILTSVALASALFTSSILAEESGAFVGGNFAYATATPSGYGSNFMIQMLV